MTRKKGYGEITPVVRRLDALIRLIMETYYPKKKMTFGAPILKSAGLTPTEIAKILGKKSATDVAPYLYPKGKKRTETQSGE